MLTLGVIGLAACGSAADTTTDRASDGRPTAMTTDAIETIVSGAEVDEPARRVRLSEVIVFTATAAFRHGSIDAGVALIRELGRSAGFSVEHAEDASGFTAERLADVDVVVFLNTTGDVLDVAQQVALEEFVRSGGGWVGVHSAADTEYDWPFYGELLGNGAWFRSHPPETSPATLMVDPGVRDHPSIAHLPATFTWEDEWYAFRAHPGDGVTTLLRLDESSYDAGDSSMADDHPISWAHAVGDGRAWYTGVGHRREIYADPDYQAHLLGGLRWAAGDG